MDETMEILLTFLKESIDLYELLMVVGLRIRLNLRLKNLIGIKPKSFKKIIPKSSTRDRKLKYQPKNNPTSPLK